MKQLITLVALFILLAGCVKKEPQMAALPLADPVLSSPEITLFKQSLPIDSEVLHKAYKKISPKIGLANMALLRGKSFSGEFVFDENSLPFIEYRFDKPYLVKKIELKKSGFVVDGKAESSHIKKFEILFFDAQKSPLYTGELDAKASVIDAFNNIEADGFILKTRSVYVPKNKKMDENDIVAAFDGRIEVEVIDAEYVYDIVAPVLSKRESSTSNEELLQTIALLNSELFKRLRLKRNDFNLPKTSLMYLPNDADMHYAVANTEEIYKTGKYKTLAGEYKIHIFSEEAEFDSKNSGELKKHAISVKDSKRNLKTTTQIPPHEEFIDFSEGL